VSQHFQLSSRQPSTHLRFLSPELEEWNPLTMKSEYKDKEFIYPKKKETDQSLGKRGPNRGLSVK
jgi:hypothetical protein